MKIKKTTKTKKTKRTTKKTKARVIQKAKGKGPNINININQSQKGGKGELQRSQPSVISTSTPQFIPQPIPMFNQPALPPNPFETAVRNTQRPITNEPTNELEKPKPKAPEPENEDVIDFSLSELSSKSVLIYLNGRQLLAGLEYEFAETKDFFNVLCEINDGDKFEVYEYVTTDGSFCPPTPTKLGLYPKFEPAIFVDESFLEQHLLFEGTTEVLLLRMETIATS